MTWCWNWLRNVQYMNMTLTWYHFLSPYPIHAQLVDPPFYLALGSLSISWNSGPDPDSHIFSHAWPTTFLRIVVHPGISSWHDLTHLRFILPARPGPDPPYHSTMPVSQFLIVLVLSGMFQGPRPDEHFGPLITIFCIKFENHFGKVLFLFCVFLKYDFDLSQTFSLLQTAPL